MLSNTIIEHELAWGRFGLSWLMFPFETLKKGGKNKQYTETRLKLLACRKQCELPGAAKSLIVFLPLAFY